MQHVALKLAAPLAAAAVTLLVTVLQSIET